MKHDKIITIYDEKYNYILKLTKTTYMEYNYNTESDFDFYSDFIKTVFNNIYKSINDAKYTIDIVNPHRYIIGKTIIRYSNIVYYNSCNENLTSGNGGIIDELKYHSLMLKKKFKNIKETLDSNALKGVKKVYEE
jgi:hypothetical protein